jgi:glycosyltransferase 2 family protein
VLAGYLAWPHLAGFQGKLFLRTLSELDSRWLAAGTALWILSYIGRVARWRVLMWPARAHFGRLIGATFIGFAGVVLLGRAGELVRPVLIARRERSTVPAQLAVWLLERLFDLLLILLLFGVSLVEASPAGLPSGSPLRAVVQVGGGLVALAATAAGTILYLLAKKPAYCRREIMRALGFLPDSVTARISCILDSFLSGAQSIRNGRIAFYSLLLTFVEWGIILSAIACYFQAHPASRDMRLVNSAVFLGFVSVGNIVQLPGIGGGVQVASVVTMTELFHLPFEVAAGLALLIWAGAALIVLPIGLPLAISGHVRWSELKGEYRPDAAAGPQVGEESDDRFGPGDLGRLGAE